MLIETNGQIGILDGRRAAQHRLDEPCLVHRGAGGERKGAVGGQHHVLGKAAPGGAGDRRADGKIGDVRPELVDQATKLMTKDTWRLGRTERTLNAVNVGQADAAGFDAHPYLARARGRFRVFLHFEAVFANPDPTAHEFHRCCLRRGRIRRP